jgi:hypothetical protein
MYKSHFQKVADIQETAYLQTMRQYGLEKAAVFGMISKGIQGMGRLRQATTLAGAGVGALGGMMSAGPNAGFGETAARTVGGAALGGVAGYGVGGAMRAARAPTFSAVRAGGGARPVLTNRGAAAVAAPAAPRLGTNTMGRAAAAPAAAGATAPAAAGTKAAAQPGFFRRNAGKFLTAVGLGGVATGMQSG